MTEPILPGAEPFFLDGGMRACLLIHGFTASPFEMRYLGTKLNEAGYTVCAPRLPGHGTSVRDLDRTGWIDWYREVVSSFESLAEVYPKVFVVGMSAGGTLALYLLSHGVNAAGSAVLSVPVRFHSTLIRKSFALLSFVPGLRLIPAARKKSGPDIRDPQMKGKLVTYSHGPVRAGLQFIRFMGMTEKRLGRVTAPLIILQSVNDHVVPADNPGIIMNGVSSQVKRLVWFDESYHILTWDVEKDEVARTIIEFFDGL
ncbi:MAG: alpha/beta fold hydrolase [Deltaproteobacteria bacterium]|nr:alpha/beta fold hydrolase [Candidatus Zymogenaceae bacterium]